MSDEKDKLVCGIIMPISAIDGCSEGHWADIQDILLEAIEEAGFEGNLVSNADDAGIIHKRIIQNLYDNPIVVCDVSGKNPNVMFELGIRLAFDKPTIIVKDDKTAYSFDTSAIEHIEYPRDLRFSKIVEFKQKLSEKIKATHVKAQSDPSYTTFLKHFGEFTVAKIDKKEVSGQEYIIEELKSLRYAMRRMERAQMPREAESDLYVRRISGKPDLDICMGDKSEKAIAEGLDLILTHPFVIQAEIIPRGNHKHIIAEVRAEADISELEQLVGGRARMRRKLKRNDADSKGA